MQVTYRSQLFHTFVICRFAVYFIFVYFTLLHFVIKFAACSRQISGDMTCAFLSFSKY